MLTLFLKGFSWTSKVIEGHFHVYELVFLIHSLKVTISNIHLLFLIPHALKNLALSL
jgi:hypothetical protein